jgi:heat shock protein HslJ
MKAFFYLLLFLCFSCASSKNTTDQALTGNWELAVFPTNEKTIDELFGQRRPELQFEVTGMVTGTTGCNRMTGRYSLSEKRFSFGEMATTKMACPGGYETGFLDALTRVNHYEISNGQLRFLQDSALVMAFSRKN